MSGWDHVVILLSSVLQLAVPLFIVFLTHSLSLFSSSGLYKQCGEMAHGQLWTYVGNLCLCGSSGGTESTALPTKHFHDIRLRK